MVTSDECFTFQMKKNPLPSLYIQKNNSIFAKETENEPSLGAFILTSCICIYRTSIKKLEALLIGYVFSSDNKLK